MNWVTLPIRRVFRVVNGGTPTSDPENWEGPIAWATPVDVGRSHGKTISKTERTLTAAGLLAGSRSIPKGCLLVSSRAPIGYVTETTSRMAFNQGCKGLEPVQAVDIRFFRYQLSAMGDDLQSRGQGSTFLELSGDALAATPVVVPPNADQRSIADYLDIETARIDALISKKQRMVRLLGERWRAEVMNTIYADDSVRQGTLRHFVDLLPGHAFPSSRFENEGVRLLRGANIEPGRLRWDTDVVYLAAEDRRRQSSYELAEGDLVLGMDRPFIGSGIRVAFVTASDLPCLLVQRVARIRGTKQANLRYIRFLIECDAFVAHLSPVTTGVSVPHISAEQILSFRGPFPSRDVQHAIANRLERTRASLSLLRDRLTKQIGLLIERRRALITAAVTGQLAIPGVAA